MKVTCYTAYLKPSGGAALQGLRHVKAEPIKKRPSWLTLRGGASASGAYVGNELKLRKKNFAEVNAGDQKCLAKVKTPAFSSTRLWQRDILKLVNLL